LRCARTTGRSRRSARRAKRRKPNATNTDALISIGTNSTRLLVQGSAGEVVAVDSRGTRLGTGLRHTGRLDPAACERTLAVVDEYVGVVRSHGARVACIATSAMRRASDGDAFAAELERRIGAPPRVLSGDEEAAFSFLGATASVTAGERVGVLDVGGGSSELAVDVPARARERNRVAFTVSAEIGAVRLAEAHPEILGAEALEEGDRSAVSGAAREDVRAALLPYAAAPRPDRLMVVGGTAFTAAAMIGNGPLRDGVRMSHGQRLSLIDALLARTLDERKAMPFIRPQRADILPAGLLIIDEACDALGIDAVTVSVDDLLAGYLASAEYDEIAIRIAG
jgi:exopolyphosphatase/guanosine-5'-triphosphate,3'-diphosphate pyrophosphatase